MAAKFDFNDGPANGAGNESGGAASNGPGSTSGTGTIKDTNSGVTAGNSGVESGQAGTDPNNLTKLGTPRKRRPGGGRKPGSTNANTSNIPSGAAINKSGTEGLAIKNDRAKVKTNIAGLHAMAAVLTKQPILSLNDNEASALTNSLCDVADYHGINLITAGGAFGLYASLATCCYMIYIPRIVSIKETKKAVTSNNEGPPMPGEARASAMNGAGVMNYGNDVSN